MSYLPGHQALLTRNGPWLVVSSYTLGGFIHLLLLIAIAVVLIRIIQGRRPV
jgi:hypothetical protein